MSNKDAWICEFCNEPTEYLCEDCHGCPDCCECDDPYIDPFEAGSGNVVHFGFEDEDDECE